MTHLEEDLGDKLHPWLGASEGLPKETEQRTHVVTYLRRLDCPFEDIIPVPPPVDVMPAVREGSHLRDPRARERLGRRRSGEVSSARSSSASVNGSISGGHRHGEGLGRGLIT